VVVEKQRYPTRRSFAPVITTTVVCPRRMVCPRLGAVSFHDGRETSERQNDCRQWVAPTTGHGAWSDRAGVVVEKQRYPTRRYFAPVITATVVCPRQMVCPRRIGVSPLGPRWAKVLCPLWDWCVPAWGQSPSMMAGRLQNLKMTVASGWPQRLALALGVIGQTWLLKSNGTQLEDSSPR
jgi:hypothetical protein